MRRSRVLSPSRSVSVPCFYLQGRSEQMEFLETDDWLVSTSCSWTSSRLKYFLEPTLRPIFCNDFVDKVPGEVRPSWSVVGRDETGRRRSGRRSWRRWTACRVFCDWGDLISGNRRSSTWRRNNGSKCQRYKTFFLRREHSRLTSQSVSLGMSSQPGLVVFASWVPISGSIRNIWDLTDKNFWPLQAFPDYFNIGE